MLAPEIEAQVVTASYLVSPFPLGSPEARIYCVYVEAVEPGKFTITDGGLLCVSHEGEWHHRGHVSRDALEREENDHFFEFDEAIEMAKRKALEVVHRGMTVEDAIAMQSMSQTEKREFKTEKYHRLQVEQLRERFGLVPMPSNVNLSEKFASLDKASDAIAYIVSLGEYRRMHVHSLVAKSLLWTYSAVSQAEKFGQNAHKFKANTMDMTITPVSR